MSKLTWVNHPRLRAALSLLANGGRLDPDDAVEILSILRDESAFHIKRLIGKRYYKKFYPTNRYGKPWDLDCPKGIVDHYTAGVAARGTLRWFSAEPRGPGVSNSSAHIVIDHDGTIVIVVNPLTYVAWHAPGVNSTHIGIEHVNAGLLRKHEGKLYYQKRRTYPVERYSRIEEINGECWEPYTTAQIVSNVILKRLFLCIFSTMTRAGFVDHQQVDPNRKRDCGPLWPLDAINSLAFSGIPTGSIAALEEERLSAIDTSCFGSSVEKAIDDVRRGHLLDKMF